MRLLFNYPPAWGKCSSSTAAALQHIMRCTRSWSESKFQGCLILPGSFIVLKRVIPLKTSSALPRQHIPFAPWVTCPAVLMVWIAETSWWDVLLGLQFFSLSMVFPRHQIVWPVLTLWPSSAARTINEIANRSGGDNRVSSSLLSFWKPVLVGGPCLPPLETTGAADSPPHSFTNLSFICRKLKVQTPSF